MNNNKENITWTSYEPLENDEVILELQIKYNIILPDSLVELIKEKNKGRPNCDVFDTAKIKERIFGELLSFNKYTKGSVLTYIENTKDRMSEKLIPFACDPSGDLICLDYRESLEQPSVIFWWHDTSEGEEIIEYVAKSFDEFLNKLYTPPEIDWDRLLGKH